MRETVICQQKVLDPIASNEFYGPERGDVVLNPLDDRWPHWTPLLELRPGYAKPDPEAHSESLFSDPPRQADVASTPFFPTLQPDALSESAPFTVFEQFGDVIESHNLSITKMNKKRP